MKKTTKHILNPAIAILAKARFKAAIVSISLVILSCAATYARDDSSVIAREKDIPGKFKAGECMPYAQELYERFVKAGGEAHLVVYKWQNLRNGFEGRWSSSSGRHAMVVYRDAKGRYFGIDNQTWKPVWLKGSAPEEWAQFFSGMDVATKVITSRTELALRGRYPDRSSQGSVTRFAAK